MSEILAIVLQAGVLSPLAVPAKAGAQAPGPTASLARIG